MLTAPKYGSNGLLKHELEVAKGGLCDVHSVIAQCLHYIAKEEDHQHKAVANHRDDLLFQQPERVVAVRGSDFVVQSGMTIGRELREVSDL